MGQARATGHVGKKRIGDMLVEAGLITQGMLREALDVQRERGSKIVETLIHLGHITVDDFVNFLSRQPGVASLDLRRYQVQQEIVSLIPREVAVKLEAFPVDRMGRLLTLAMACPLDAASIGDIETRTGLRVKPILCPAADIHAAIEMYYDGGKKADGPPAAAAAPTPQEAEKETPAVMAGKARTGIKLTQVVEQLRQLTSLPALPSTVARVQEALGDVTISPKEIAQAIAQDPAVAMKLLSVANSPAYGFASHVETIELAVALLGLRETYSIVLSAAVMNLFEVKKRFDYQRFWEEALNTAGAARILARCCGKNKEGGAFACGLLHDIGRIALLEIVPDLYAQIPPQLSGAELVEAEQKIVGLSHAEAGYELAVHWQLPYVLTLAIRHHHHPEQAPDHRMETAVVAVAEAWTRDARVSDKAKKDVLTATAPLLALMGLDGRAAETAYDLVAQLPRAEYVWDPVPGGTPAKKKPPSEPRRG